MRTLFTSLGFPRSCLPALPGENERQSRAPIRDLRGNFLYGREFLGDGDLAAQAQTWMDRTANLRTHATTREQPLERFNRDERDQLRPLASRPYRS
jgi:hypothetical protein